MRVSGTGAAVGAVLGAFARGAVVLLNLWAHGADRLAAFALPSAGIGLLVGGIAGATGKPLLGAIVGALLSGVVFEFFMCACASALGGREGGRVLSDTLIYGLEMALAGALAGGLGGAAGRKQDKTRLNGSADKEAPGSEA
jgi:hypothetical protein